jgi:ADP-L-glycero-D-manno-heptose 6-epimerase
MILVTGGAGFIGSCLVARLNEAGKTDILVADRLGTEGKWLNLAKRKIRHVVHKDDLFKWLDNDYASEPIEAVIHMGACSSTAERDVDYLMRNNVQYTMRLWQMCARRQIPFIYASSGATYGMGERGFSDDHAGVDTLRPIAAYGYSKHLFDQWALAQKDAPPFWAGLKFFNVYGPQEYHKGSMLSMPYRAYQQIKETGRLRLFKSYDANYADGKQLRDFVYVMDVVDVMTHFMTHAQKIPSGIYNVGTGRAESWLDVAHAVFEAMGKKPAVDFMEMPEEMRARYQYFTQADLTKLRDKARYTKTFKSVNEGCQDYVRRFLAAEDSYL